MTSSETNTNFLPPDLVSNLQNVLLKRNPNQQSQISDDSTDIGSDRVGESQENLKPIVLVTNADGIDSLGLRCLVEALVVQGLYNVHVIAPQSDKSVAGHGVTVGETVAVTSAEIDGATAYEVSGTPVDCVSLALSGALFSWSKPVLVISGVNKGSSCGQHMFYSGVVAGAREALISGVPSISISLNWKKDESQETDFKDAVSVCLPVINAAITDIETGIFPKSCLLKIEVPTSPSANKGFKLTKQSLWRETPCWQAISANRHPHAGRFMSNQQSLGMQLAQLGRDASAAGAARRLTTQKKNIVEVESVGASGKSDSNRTSKNFRLEFLEKESDDVDEDLDFRALANGFVAITPVSLSPHVETDTQESVSSWISTALQAHQ